MRFGPRFSQNIVFHLIAAIVMYSFPLIAQNKEMYPPNPLISSNIGKYSHWKRDKSGIPINNIDGDQVHYPISIAQIALTGYAHWVATGDLESKADFLKIAEWLQINCIKIHDFCTWNTDARVKGYILPSSWSSAMAQGLGISVMVEAYKLTGSKKFEDTALRAVAAFGARVKDGGVTNQWLGDVWYEEYGSPTSPTHVLNGFIFSLSGLYDAWNGLNSHDAGNYFQAGVKSLLHKLSLYDLHFTSRYDYSPLNQIASANGEPPDHYHELHILQLLWLHSVTCESYFKIYASKFLEEDMGEFNMISNLLNRKLKNVYASFTTEPKEYGVTNLLNSLWSYGRYWSSYRFPVTITIELPAVRPLDGIVFVSPSKDSLPNDFELSYWDHSTDRWVSFLRVNHRNEPHWEYYYRTRHHESFINTYPLSSVVTNKLKLVISEPLSGDSVKLRALDIHYDRHEDIEKLMKLYPSHHCAMGQSSLLFDYNEK